MAAPQWTTFTASPDTKIVYVSSSGGNDAFSGASTGFPKATLAAGYAELRDGFPDWLLLKKGDTWTESFPSWTKSGRSTTEPMVVNAYGTGARPHLQTGNVDGIFLGNFALPAKGHLAFVGFSVKPHTYTGAGSEPNNFHMLGYWTDILLEDIFSEKSAGNFVFDSNEGGLSNIRVRYCVSVDAFRTDPDHAHIQGLYIAGTNGVLLEGCIFDHNGWSETIPGADPDIFRHNVYIQGHDGFTNDCSNVVTRELISCRGAATGMQQRPGGFCDNSLFLQNPLNLVFGTLGGIVQNCIAMDSRDIDGSNPRGVGFNLVNSSPGATTLVDSCIAMYRTPPGSYNIIAYAADQCQSCTLKNCKSWKWHDSAGHGQAVNANNCPIPTQINCNMEQVAPTKERSILTYMAYLGFTPTYDAFYAILRAQSKDTWDNRFSAGVINDYIRAGWGLYADCNNDGVLTSADFTCFLQKYVAGDMSADCDGDGKLTVREFTCFLAKYAKGQ